MSKPLPTENGVYIPTGSSTESGPNVFVLYGGYWRCSPHPDGWDGRHWVVNANERWGLTKLAIPTSQDVGTE